MIKNYIVIAISVRIKPKLTFWTYHAALQYELSRFQAYCQVFIGILLSVVVQWEKNVFKRSLCRLCVSHSRLFQLICFRLKFNTMNIFPSRVLSARSPLALSPFLVFFLNFFASYRSISWCSVLISTSLCNFSFSFLREALIIFCRYLSTPVSLCLFILVSLH